MLGHHPQPPGGRSSVSAVCRPAAAAAPLAQAPRPGDRVLFEASRAARLAEESD